MTPDQNLNKVLQASDECLEDRNASLLRKVLTKSIVYASNYWYIKFIKYYI